MNGRKGKMVKCATKGAVRAVTANVQCPAAAFEHTGYEKY